MCVENGAAQSLAISGFAIKWYSIIIIILSFPFFFLEAKTGGADRVLEG